MRTLVFFITEIKKKKEVLKAFKKGRKKWTKYVLVFLSEYVLRISQDKNREFKPIKEPNKSFSFFYSF
jgi:hypothetical protein